MSTQRWRQRLINAMQNQAFDAAAQTLAHWIDAEPKSAEPRLHHARLLLMQGHYRDAFAVATNDIVGNDCPPELALEVINCLRSFSAHDALADWAARYPARTSMPPQQQALGAASLSACGSTTLALEWANAAAAVAPRDAICRVNQALIMNYAGAFADAERVLETLIDQGEDASLAHWLLARLRRQTPDRNHVERLRERLQRANLHPKDRIDLAFALFKELDDLDDTTSAWQALQNGCELMRVLNPYRPEAVESLFAATRHTFDCDSGSIASPQADNPAPIFIVGMHRSGTTLVERVIGEHEGVHCFGETRRLTAALCFGSNRACSGLLDYGLIESAAALDADLAAAHFFALARRQAGNARFVTEKTPGNFQLLGFIRRLFPNAKVVHCRRDPMDLCFANLHELFADSVNHSYALPDISHHYAHYRSLMTHWHDLFPGFILDVDYEDLVTDPAAHVRRIRDFCGLPQSVQTGPSFVNTLSSMQSRQPIHTRSIGKWRRYAAELAPLKQMLAAT